MHIMLFRKRIPRACAYCANGAKVTDDQILCTKVGVVSVYYQCRKFKYDPCKRIPHKTKALDFGKYDQEDYSL